MKKTEQERDREFMTELLEAAIAAERRDEDPSVFIPVLIKKYVSYQNAKATEWWCDQT